MADLLKLTIAALEAATWIDTLPVGALPTPREPMSTAEKEQRKAAAMKGHETQARNRLRRQEVLKARSATHGIESRGVAEATQKVPTV